MGKNEFVSKCQFADINKNETEFLFKEIFEARIYLQNHLTLNSDAVVFDIGANIGVFSFFVFTYCKDARVFAFEPIPEIFEVLKANARQLNWNIELFNAAVSDSAKNLEFTYYPKSSLQSSCYANIDKNRKLLKASALYQQKELGLSVNNYLLDKLIESKLESNKVTCLSVTISEIIKECRVENIDLLKIDVEGSECDVIQGVKSEDWNKIKQVVVEIDNNKNIALIDDVLSQHGFRTKKQYYKPLLGTTVCMLYASKRQSLN